MACGGSPALNIERLSGYTAFQPSHVSAGLSPGDQESAGRVLFLLILVEASGIFTVVENMRIMDRVKVPVLHTVPHHSRSPLASHQLGRSNRQSAAERATKMRDYGGVRTTRSRLKEGQISRIPQ